MDELTIRLSGGQSMKVEVEEFYGKTVVKLYITSSAGLYGVELTAQQARALSEALLKGAERVEQDGKS